MDGTTKHVNRPITGAVPDIRGDGLLIGHRSERDHPLVVVGDSEVVRILTPVFSSNPLEEPTRATEQTESVTRQEPSPPIPS